MAEILDENSKPVQNALLDRINAPSLPMLLPLGID